MSVIYPITQSSLPQLQHRPRHIRLTSQRPRQLCQRILHRSIILRIAISRLLACHSRRYALADNSRLENVKSHAPVHIGLRVVVGRLGVPREKLLWLWHAGRAPWKHTRHIVGARLWLRGNVECNSKLAYVRERVANGGGLPATASVSGYSNR